MGVPEALLSAPVLGSLLFGVNTTDPATYAGVIVVLAVAGACAAFVPARRAASLEPTTVLTE